MGWQSAASKTSVGTVVVMPMVFISVG